MSPSSVILISGWAHGPESMSSIARSLGDTHEVSSLSPAQMFVEDGKAAPIASDNGHTRSPCSTVLESYIRKAAEPVWLIGWSLGGMLAIEAAAASPPERIAGLVLLGTTARFCSAESFDAGVPPSHVRSMRQALRRRSTSMLEDFFTQASLPANIPEEERKRKVEAALETGEAALAHGLEYLQTIDLRPGLESITSSCLVIHGKEDRIVPWRASEYLDRHLPHCSAHFLPEAGHGLVDQCESFIIHQIGRFMESRL